MKFLQSLLEAATQRDINTYYGHVKRALKGDAKFAAGKASRSSIASAVHDIAENDPDSTIDRKAVIDGVHAKYKAHHAAKAQVKEGLDTDSMQSPTETESPLSSKDRSFDPSKNELDNDEGTDSDVEELKELRCRDIGDELTPEQQEELESLRGKSGSGESDTEDCDPEECDDDECFDADCPIHGKMASTKPAPAAAMGESVEMTPKAKAALKKRAAKGAEEEEEVPAPAKKKTIGRDLDESVRTERVNRLEELSTSILAGITRKTGSFLK